jgi:hypothetical protein
MFFVFACYFLVEKSLKVFGFFFCVVGVLEKLKIINS